MNRATPTLALKDGINLFFISAPWAKYVELCYEVTYAAALELQRLA
jgi:hypothetical protein